VEKRKRKKEMNSPPSSADVDKHEALEPKDGPQACHYHGWSAHGINRYNQLFDQIEKEKNTPHWKCYEEKLQAFFQVKVEIENKECKKAKVPVASLPIPRHQLWSLDTVVTAVSVEAKQTDPPSSSDESDNDDEDKYGATLN
jgi:hypothetical protein